MTGIDFNKPILYKHASFRYFEKKEHHVNRFCKDDVLLLVFDGVLRFSENGNEIEVKKGEYYIQKANLYQRGDIESLSPSYLYVHFSAPWGDDGSVLPRRGNFSYENIKELMKKLDEASHGGKSYTECTAIFYNILLALQKDEAQKDTADIIYEYLCREYTNGVTLEKASKNLSYSKNHIINKFKEKYGKTPADFVNELKIRKCMNLLESTSKTSEEIMFECGFNNYSHYYRLFVRKNGVSPSEWRANVRSNPQNY